MFYEPGQDHGLPYDPFKSCVIPRPIGWISTLSPAGIANLAPYSQFQMLNFDPPYVMFSANQTLDARQKDSAANALATGEFVWNMATYELREAVNLSSEQVAPEVDEFEIAGVTKAPSRLVKPPRVKESPVQFECRVHSSLRLPGNNGYGGVDLVIGSVIGIHIADSALTDDGKLDVLKIKPIARLGYLDYCAIESVFSMVLPGTEEERRSRALRMGGWTGKPKSAG